MAPSTTSFAVRSHLVSIEQLERQRWRVSVDGRRLSIYCTESRARAAGRVEARRLDFVAHEAGRAEARPVAREAAKSQL
jgi:hypothetical protein